MTEEELLRQARLLGEDCPEELTYGELVEGMETAAERDRRFFQRLSVIAYRHAVLTARALAGERLPPVGAVFPFWTQEEQDAARLARYREMLERLAGRRGKETEHGTQ